MPVITTNGWDTAFATTYTNINAQMTAQWPAMIAKSPTLGQMKCSLKKGKVTADLTLDPWQLGQGGSGGLVRLDLPIKAGKMSGIDDDYDLKGQKLSIELSLQWVPQPKQIQFAISENVPAIKADLGTNAKPTTNIIQAFAHASVTLSPSAVVTIGTKDIAWKITDSTLKMSFYLFVTNVGGANSLIEVYQYNTHSLVVAPKTSITPVTVINAGNIEDEIDGPIFKEMVAQSIDENLKEFDYIFATVDVVTQLAKDDVWAWLQPTTNGYAVIEPLEKPTNDNCVFAILSMVNNRVNSSPVLQVDPKAIAKNCTSSLLISPDMFIENILFPGVASIFQGSTLKDFEINYNNLSVTNTKELTWANVKLDDKTVTLSVSPKNFSMVVQNNRITVSFSNLNYPITMVGKTVGHVDIIFTGQFILGLKAGSNGNKTLWFDIPSDQSNITNVVAVMDQSYYTVEKIIGIVTIALSVIALGAAGGAKLAEKVGAKAVIQGGTATAEVAAEDVTEVLDEVLEEGKDFEAGVTEDALEMTNETVVEVKKASLWTTVAKFSGFGAVLTGVAEGGMQVLQACLENASKNQWEKTPAFSNFANMAISRYTFGGLSTFEVKSASLADSMQIGFIIPPEYM